MKEKYEKPEIAFVSFELSQSIAAGCSAISNAADYVCPITIPEFHTTILYDGNVCKYTNVNPDDLVCYHAPSDNNGVHSS